MKVGVIIRIGLVLIIACSCRAFVCAQTTFEPESVFVEGGKFKGGYEKEHWVNGDSIQSFYIGKFEVTQAQWKMLMGDNPSLFKNCDNCPVEFVTIYQALEYIACLNEYTGKKYRLPTQNEWEYAARGGQQSKNYVFSGSDSIADVAWYTENSDFKSYPVGTKQPNELGIYDMTGNVDEWCSDWEDISGEWNPFYVSSSDYKGSKPLMIRNRVVRGCSMYGDPRQCHVAASRLINPNDFSPEHGFRVVYTAPHQ